MIAKVKPGKTKTLTLRLDEKVSKRLEMLVSDSGHSTASKLIQELIGSEHLKQEQIQTLREERDLLEDRYQEMYCAMQDLRSATGTFLEMLSQERLEFNS